jgi:hypothetical protein
VRPSISLAGLATLLGVACTTIIGLPDLPDAPGGAGTSSTGNAGTGATRGGAASTAGTGANEAGDAGSTGAGEGGGSSGGSSNGGSSAGGSSQAGSSTGGNSTGGTAVQGMCPSDRKLCGDMCADLTSDKDHCGDCDTKCDGCSLSRCYTVLVPVRPWNFAVNASHVYFAEAGNVARVPRAGGSVQVLSPTGGAAAIVLDQANVYWVERVSPDDALKKVPLAGGTAQQLATGIAASSIAVDASFVYASNIDSSGSGTGSIVKVPVAGGAAVTLASAQLNNGPLAIDSTYVYWANLGDGTERHNTDGSIMRVPKAGGSVVSLAANLDGPRSLVLANNFLYFGNWDSIQKVPTTGGAVSTVTTMTGATVLAADASSIYACGTAELKPLLQLSLAGVEQSTLAATGDARPIVVDSGVVFWADSMSLNSIAKMP